MYNFGKMDSRLLTCTTTLEESGLHVKLQLKPKLINEVSSRTCDTISTEGCNKIFKTRLKDFLKPINR